MMMVIIIRYRQVGFKDRSSFKDSPLDCPSYPDDVKRRQMLLEYDSRLEFSDGFDNQVYFMSLIPGDFLLSKYF